MKTGFLLDAAGIGQDLRCASEQALHIEIAERLNQTQSFGVDTEPRQGLARARMQLQHDGLLAGRVPHMTEQCAQV